MKESRLFKILYILLEKGHATGPELAKKFEVSVRTIYRDIDALSGAGIPVYTETGRRGGIYLMPGYVLDKTLLSEGEKEEILTALQSLNAARSVHSEGVLAKLSGVFNVSTENWLEVDFSRWHKHKNDNEKFDQLKAAVIHSKAVMMTYASAHEAPRARKVLPLKLLYKSTAWYVKAYCPDRKVYRLFKLSRILAYEVLNEHFAYRSFPEEVETSTEAYKAIKLLFPKEMAYRVYDEFDCDEVIEEKNGDLFVTATMPQDTWLIGFLLSFGTQVEIVEPIYLKEILANEAMQIVKKNKR